MRDLVSHPIPPRILGQSTKGGLTLLNDSDRKDHFHVLGAPDQGKSKFLHRMMDEDIIQLLDPKIPFNSGFCFLDAGTNAGTMRNVLKSCALRGFKKVLIIDPHDDKYVVPINPFEYKEDSEAIAGKLMDTVRLIWGTEDPMKEAIIRKYLPRVFRAMHAAELTLPDTSAFLYRLPQQYQPILTNPKLDFDARHELFKAMTKEADWRDFQSTARRLDVFYTKKLKLMFASRKGVNFRKLIKDGWVILVNLFPDGAFLPEHAKALGLIVINEITYALQRMVKNGYNIPYGVYIDEVGFFASRKLATILDYYRHINMRLVMAHQGLGQIEDPFVLQAIRRSAKNKILFWTALSGDRTAMCRDMGYGGDISLEQVTYVTGDTPKQEAYVRIGKQPPVKTRMKHWPDADVSNKELDEFVRELKTSNPQLYRPVGDVWGEIKTRFASTQETPQFVRRTNLAPKEGSNTKVPKRGKRNDSAAARKGDTVLERGEEGRSDSHFDSGNGNQAGKDIPVSFDLPVDNTDAGPAPERGKGKKK